MMNYVIVGGSAAATAAVEAIRRRDHVSNISVISDELYVPYSRPLISELLSGEISLNKLKQDGRNFWEKNGVNRIFGSTAVKVDPTAKTVTLEDGREIAFDKLLIATGGRPFIPKIEGCEKGGVYTFTRIEDAVRISRILSKVRRVVVIGGGLIGISATESLVKRGKKATIVELKERILSQILDATASKMFEDRIRAEGVDVVTEHTVKEVVSEGDSDLVSGVILDDGSKIKCELVLMTIGVVPAINLVKDSGVRVKRGIIVDDHMRTSVPDIYACGDVAETYDFAVRENRLLQLWPVAKLTGRVAGLNISGQDKRYEGATMMCSLSYFNIPAVSVGLANLDGGEDFQVYRSHDRRRGIYKKVVFRDDRLVGMTFVRDIEMSGILFNLMRRRKQLKRFKRPLINGRLEVIRLPIGLREEVLRG